MTVGMLQSLDPRMTASPAKPPGSLYKHLTPDVQYQTNPKENAMMMMLGPFLYYQNTRSDSWEKNKTNKIKSHQGEDV